jgi:hypothetical protein
MSNKTRVHYPEPNKPALQQKIVEIVKDNSGGLKFTELTFILSSEPGFIGKEYSYDVDRFLHDIEWYCRHTKRIKVLDYTHRPIKRAKMFIYTP